MSSIDKLAGYLFIVSSLCVPYDVIRHEVERARFYTAYCRSQELIRFASTNPTVPQRIWNTLAMGELPTLATMLPRSDFAKVSLLERVGPNARDMVNTGVWLTQFSVLAVRDFALGAVEEWTKGTMAIWLYNYAETLTKGPSLYLLTLLLGGIIVASVETVQATNTVSVRTLGARVLAHGLLAYLYWMLHNLNTGVGFWNAVTTLAAMHMI